MRRILIIVAIFLIPVIPIILVVSGALKNKPTTLKRITLTMWGTEDSPTAFTNTIARYNSGRSHITINYQKIRPEDYTSQLVTAWAQGKGPDLFFVPNTHVGQMIPFATSMPADLTVPQIETTKGLFGSRQKIINTSFRAPSVNSIREQYVDGVMNDVYREGKIWGLPLAMDTIVMYYNKDLLNNAKIFEPAKTWSELVTQITDNRLTITNDAGDIVQSAVAIGTAGNVPYATDVLMLLMMQNGAVILNGQSKAGFDGPEGVTALDFYTSFANDKKVSYSWNDKLPNAREAFLRGKVAYFFGTLADRAEIDSSSLNWAVAPMLHLTPEGDNDGISKSQRLIDATRYQVLMVSKSSQTAKRSVQAWNFLYNTAREKYLPLYLAPARKLAPIKSILAKQKNEATFSVYAGQLLTARSWYTGRDAVATERYLNDLITSVGTGQAAADALKLAGRQVESTL